MNFSDTKYNVLEISTESDPDKIEKVQNWPTTVDLYKDSPKFHVRRETNKKKSRKAPPAGWKWGLEQEIAFKTLFKKLKSIPFLDLQINHIILKFILMHQLHTSEQ